MVSPPATTFFRSRWVEPPEGVGERDPAELARDFRAAGVACGLKGGGGTDVGLVACEEEGVRSALLLTRNAAAAAPVRVCRDDCEPGAIRAAVVNSGNANAATGARGYRDALAMQAAAAGALELEPTSVAVAETGTIGGPLPIGQGEAGLGAAATPLDPWGGRRLAGAIVTAAPAPQRCQ